MAIRERIGYLAGVFDYCHQGHINIIKKSIENCDTLVVAVVSDNFANKYKNQEIKYNENQRVSMIKDLDLGVEIPIPTLLFFKNNKLVLSIPKLNNLLILVVSC